MIKLSRSIAIAIAIVFAATATAGAHGHPKKAAAKKAKVTTPKARAVKTQKARTQSKRTRTRSTSLKLSGAAAKKAVKARPGQAKNFQLVRTSVSPTGKTVHFTTVTKGTNEVGRISVRKATKVTYKNQAPRTISEAQARKIANTQLRRERNGAKGAGTFSGVNSSGITRNGNYKFTSATDRNQFVYVSAKTGKVRNTDK